MFESGGKKRRMRKELNASQLDAGSTSFPHWFPVNLVLLDSSFFSEISCKRCVVTAVQVSVAFVLATAVLVLLLQDAPVLT